ncbi:mechanosensitive ion channel protein [Endomicrobiia bacterium]|nr:mechanosensitive ion channel protein [Endomicrobiia bacterium]GHT75397.1 mechanosensitive ion channel protein [Endomicrobiia bacterium]
MIKSLLSTASSKNFELWIESVLLFALIFCAGFLFKKYVAKFIQNMLARIGLILSEDMVIMSSSYISFWFFLIALYVAFLRSPINNTSTSLVVKKFFYAAFAFSIVILIASVVSRFFHKFVHERIGSNVIKFIVIFIGLMLILTQIGINFTPILAALSVGTLTVGLALQDTLGNFFAGINILTSKQISRNDYIKLDSGQEGTVVDVNWRTTLIKEISGNIITVPNSKISSAIVTSFHYQRRAEVSVSINCGVAYNSDLDRVEKIAKLAAQEMINKYEDSVKTYMPVMFFTNFGDSSINFILFFRVKSVYARAFIQSEVLKNLYKRFNEEKIEIPFPQRVVTINKQ